MTAVFGGKEKGLYFDGFFLKDEYFKVMKCLRQDILNRREKYITYFSEILVNNFLENYEKTIEQYKEKAF